MSIKVTSYVWDNSTAKDGALLVLLAIADHAHDDGTGAWPTVATLARKSRMSERGVQYSLRKLEEAGELVVEPNAGPGGRNLYRILLTPAGGEAQCTPADIAPPQDLHPPGEQDCTPGVNPTAPITVNEPSNQPSSLTPPSSADADSAGASAEDASGEVIEAEFVFEKPQNAQTLIGEWIDHCEAPPPSRVTGQIAKEIKNMLDEGIAYERVRQGLAEWHQRGLHPSTLASIVHELSTPRTRPNNHQQQTDDKFARSFARAQAGINVFAMAERQLEA